MRSRPTHRTSNRFAILLVLTPACARATFEPTDASTGPDGPADVVPGFETKPICPAPAREECVPSVALPCDPVCQTGACDWCNQKCTYAYETGSAAPVPTCAALGPEAALATCTVVSSGSPRQADDCAPGSICLPPTLGDSSTYCFSLCWSDVDCPYGVACGQRMLSPAGGAVAVCDPPYDQCGADGVCCDPLANTGCDPGRYCLVVTPDLGSGHSRTVCEFSYGDGRDGSPCDSARDCQTRFVCVEGACHPICNEVNPCAPGGTCNALGSEFGYCT